MTDRSNVILFKERALVITLFGVLYINSVCGQEIRNPVPPSPTVASLMQYADVPVSNYTGVPSISIPLFNVRSGQMELPVTLTYHASGIKVAQEASWVGLGWVLNAGGAISRQVNGIDDFNVNPLDLGYLRAPLPPATADNLPDWSGDNFDTYYETYEFIKNGYYDGQPDIFHYNFFGYSGKLVFNKQSGNEVTAISIDQNNLIFKYNLSEKQWTVIDGNGWKYYLGAGENSIEITTDYSVSGDQPYSGEVDFSQNPDQPKEMITAWHLVKVITPEGDMIEFFYGRRGETQSQISYSETLQTVLSIQETHHSGNGYTTSGVPTSQNVYSASRQVVVESYLKKITFNNGCLEFTCENRDDVIPHNNYVLKPGRLKTIQLLDAFGKSIKQVDFKYSYFNQESGTDKLRLRLDAVQESNEFEKIPPYIFSYNTTPLPAKTSYSTDYWGYYNGKDNDNIRYYTWLGEITTNSGPLVSEESPDRRFRTQVPGYYFKRDDGSEIYLTGADREVDKDKIQAAMLNSIQYPTGGTVDFVYEPNDYFVGESANLYEYSNPTMASVSDRGGDDGFPEGSEREFTLNNYSVVKLFFSIEGNANTSFNFSTAALLDQYGLEIMSIFDDVGLGEDGKFEYRAAALLAPGTYRLKARVAEPDHPKIFVSITAQWFQDIIPANKNYGAGVRVKSIITKDEGQVVKQKEYVYKNNDLSTGRLISPSQFFYNYTLLTTSYNISPGNVIQHIWTSEHVVRSSSSVIPMGNSAQGNAIGYDEVSVWDEDRNNNHLGGSTFYYRNIKELSARYFIPGVPNLVNLSNGQLLKEIHFNQEGKVVKMKSTNYMRDASFENIKGVKIYSLGNSTEIRFYDIFSEWWYPVNSTDTVYDLRGENPVATTSYYKYENPEHKNLTEVKRKNSKGEWVVTTHTYPSDLSGDLDETSYSNVIDLMANVDHVINPIIRTETTVNDILVEGVITNYAKEVHANASGVASNMYLPKVVKTLNKGTTSYEKRFEYTKYDNNGNLLQVQTPAGIFISYIWGYKGQFPVAKIENATYAQVESYVADIQAKSNLDDDNCLDVSSCDESNLRVALNALRNALPGTIITTYTYDPLVGMTSMTDANGVVTYYEYDRLGRLKWLRDNDSNILSRYHYHYKN